MQQDPGPEHGAELVRIEKEAKRRSRFPFGLHREQVSRLVVGEQTAIETARNLPQGCDESLGGPHEFSAFLVFHAELKRGHDHGALSGRATATPPWTSRQRFKPRAAGRRQTAAEFRASASDCAACWDAVQGPAPRRTSPRCARRRS